MRVPDTRYEVKLPGGLRLLVKLDDRPVDFDIVFKSGKRITFSRPEGDVGTVSAVIKPDPALAKAELAPGAGRIRNWRVTEAVTRNPDDPAVEYSDPGM